MATIKGVQLKNVKKWNSPDGGGFSASIYIDGKKCGSALDYGHGGPIDVDIEKEHREKFSERVKAHFEQNPYIYGASDEHFVSDLLQLVDIEKNFKQQSRKGYPILIDMQFQKRNEDFTGAYKPPIMVSITGESIIPKVLAEHKPVVHTVYRTLADFDIA